MAVSTGLVTRAYFDGNAISNQPAIPMGSISQEVKLFFGRVYDALQICSGKIDAYNQIDLTTLGNNPSIVNAKKVNNLFLGIMPQAVVGDFSKLKSNTFFLSLLKDYEQIEVVYPEETAGQVSIPTADFEPVSASIIQQGVDEIENKIGKHDVYVHCKSGKGRSAVIVVAYVMKKIWELSDKTIQFSECFERAVKIVTTSRSANKVRKETDAKAGPLKTWFEGLSQKKL